MSERVATVPCCNPWSTTEFEHHRACLPRDGVIEHRSFASPRTPPRRERVRSPSSPCADLLGPVPGAPASIVPLVAWDAVIGWRDEEEEEEEEEEQKDECTDRQCTDEPATPTSPAETDASELLGPIIVPDTPSWRASPLSSIIVVQDTLSPGPRVSPLDAPDTEPISPDTVASSPSQRVSPSEVD